MHVLPVKKIFVMSLLLSMTVLAAAQSGNAASKPADPAVAAEASSENLNYLAGDAAMPPFTDSVVDINSELRRDLLHRGVALRVITQIQYAQNTLNGPVPADQQVYVGDRAFENAMVQPILTADLRQLHLKQAQFYMGAVWNWVSWNPAGPKSLQLWDLYFYKAFGEQQRIQLKAGYISNGLDFVGFFVGGTTAAGAQGVYAILPYEVGMSYFPLNTPSANARIRGPKETYLSFALQRSLDPNGGPAEVARNHTGFRFNPRGDKLLSINEAGYQRASGAHAHELWLRAGYMHNSTPYMSAKTGKAEPGNQCVYALADYQLTQSDLDHPNRGLYLGGSLETASEALNPYSRYFELRLYKEAPFRNRPGDTASLVASRTGYSRYFANNLVAEGQSVWRAGTSITGNYSLRASRGNYLSFGLSYVYGPAISPRAPSALKILTSWNVFF